MNPDKKVRLAAEELVAKMSRAVSDMPIDQLCRTHNAMLKSTDEILKYTRNIESYMREAERTFVMQAAAAKTT